MFRVGESTGTLDAQLGTAAAYFDRELDYKIKRFTALFEPAVLLFVGVIVGFVAIALSRHVRHLRRCEASLMSRPPSRGPR
jgi:type IV pilus assembly protein PilC